MQRQLLGLPVLERFILMSEQFQRGRILRLGNDAYLLIGTGGAQIRLFPFLGRVGEIEVWVAATLGMASIWYRVTPHPALSSQGRHHVQQI